MSKKPIYMYLKEVKKTSGKFDATHKVALYPDNVDETPKYFLEFQKQVLELFNQVFTRLDKIEQFDQFVINQFKKHGWTK